jgi:2,3-bisphosphoglycerate-independent phosphoglycerate mutase
MALTREEILTELAVANDAKIVLLVLDGLGDLPSEGKTPLEAARTPHLDRLAEESACGVTDPIMMGVTPGSGPAHLSLFGYDPARYLLGRGILEALGVDVEVGENDLVARGNFATMENGLVSDRRAGRIPTEENARICQKLNREINEIEGAAVRMFPGKEHRFVVRFTRPGLLDTLSDADPQKTGLPRTPTRALAPEAEKSAELVNAFMDRATSLLAKTPRANTVLLRGFSKYPDIPTLPRLYKLKPAAIASYPMYRGLAKLVGMEVLDVGPDEADLFATLEAHYAEYDFFFIHVKKTDSHGEDGNIQRKTAVIEKIDTLVPRILALNPEVLAVTSDHSTPCGMKGHSWHPNPFLIKAKTAMPGGTSRFSERECSRGYLGRFPAMNALPLMLAHAGRLKKFGA